MPRCTFWWIGFLGIVPACALFECLLIRGKTVAIFYIDKGPSEEVPFVGGFEPGALGWEVCSPIQIADGGLNAGEFVDIVDCLHGDGRLTIKSDLMLLQTSFVVGTL